MLPAPPLPYDMCRSTLSSEDLGDPFGDLLGEGAGDVADDMVLDGRV